MALLIAPLGAVHVSPPLDPFIVLRRDDGCTQNYHFGFARSYCGGHAKSCPNVRAAMSGQ